MKKTRKAANEEVMSYDNWKSNEPDLNAGETRSCSDEAEEVNEAIQLSDERLREIETEYSVATNHLRPLRPVHDDEIAALARAVRELRMANGLLESQAAGHKAAAAEMAAAAPDNDMAIRSGGFYVEGDVRGRPTLWCKECRRDSGYHWSICSKSRVNRVG